MTRLTFDEATDDSPVWTPDGTRVVFSSGNGGLFWKAADGTGEVEPLLEQSPRPRPFGWSTDGRLLFDVPGNNGRDIGVLTVEGEHTAELLLDGDFSEGRPALSPDSQWLAYQSNESGRNEIYVRPFPDIDSGRWQVSNDSGSLHCGRPTDRHSSILVGERRQRALVGPTASSRSR